MTSYDGGIASRFQNDHLGSAILDFLISPKPQKNTKIDKKTNQNDTKNTKRIYKYESYCKKVSFCILKNRDLPKSGKRVCQKLIAGKISDSVNTEKVMSFVVFVNIKKVVNL